MGKGKNKGRKNKKSKTDPAKQKKKQAAENKRQYKREQRRNRKKQKGRQKGWQSEWRKFEEQAAPFGLILRDVRADGNCLFSAVSDQMEGNQHKSGFYREECVQYMRDHEDEFKWFLDEDEDGEIGAYLDEMAERGTWGGNLEVVAMSRRFQINVVVHQLEAPRFEVNCEGASVRTIHLSYHQGQHYASVRRRDDDTTDPAQAITIMDIPSGDARPAPAGGYKPSPCELVMTATGCRNEPHVRDALKWNNNSVDDAIEFLLQERNTSGDAAWEVGAGAEHGQSSPAPKSKPRKKMTKREKKIAKQREKAEKRKREQQRKRDNSNRKEEPPDLDPELAAKISAIAI